MCDWCVTYLEQMDATIASLAALSDRSAEPPAALMSALRAKRDGRR